MKVPPETICGYCLQILCCSEHRLFHEMRRHGSHKRYGATPGIILISPYNSKQQQFPVNKRANLKRKRTSILPDLQESSTDDSIMSNLAEVLLACNPLEDTQNSSSMMQLEGSNYETPNRFGITEENGNFLMPPPQVPRRL